MRSLRVVGVSASLAAFVAVFAGELLGAGLVAAGVTVTVANVNSGDTDFSVQVPTIKAAIPDVVVV